MGLATTTLMLAALVAAPAAAGTGEKMDWKAFEVSDLSARRAETGRAWLEFLKAESMTAGLYELAAGSKDPQNPHEKDEIYLIIAGKADLVVAGTPRPVTAGSVVYVKARIEHRFERIEEDLRVLVVFAPGER